MLIIHCTLGLYAVLNSIILVFIPGVRAAESLLKKKNLIILVLPKFHVPQVCSY